MRDATALAKQLQDATSGGITLRAIARTAVVGTATVSGILLAWRRGLPVLASERTLTRIHAAIAELSAPP
jgi:hypothetical protein